jgi:lipopolysaccharide export system protein LptA
MPAPWVPLWIAAALGVGQGATAPSRIQLDEDLVVSSESSHFDPLTQTFTFSRGVVATYGVTTVRADRLVIHNASGDQNGEAVGHVQLEDPDVNMTAENLRFSWKPEARTGHAENAVIHIANVTLRVKRAEIKPEQWDLYDVSGTACRNDPPFIEARTRHLVVHPGKSGKAVRPTLYVLGNRIVSLPDRSFNLNPKTEGFNLPALSYRRGAGLGISFQSGFLLTPQTNLAVSAGVFPGSLPGYGATLTRSLLPEERVNNIVTPASELGERFRTGYLENIQVTSPDQERRSLRNEKRSIAVSSVWNQGSVARGTRVSYSKPLEGVYEVGGAADDIGFIGQARMQTIRANNGPIHTRLLLSGTAGITPRPIAANLDLVGRVDTSLFLGTNFGWVRGSAGLVYHPVPQVALAGGAFLSQEFGSTIFEVDRLYAKNGFVFRADFNLGPTKFSYMQKWDQTLGWFDREYTASQVVGCLEPFVLYRKYPNDYNFGVRFRLDEFYDVLRRRDFRRSKTNKVQVSPGPDGKP